MKILNTRKMIWQLLFQLANLNLAIFILLLIVSFSLLGFVIEQDQDLLYYQSVYPLNNYTLLSFDWRFIVYFGLNHVYQSYSFLFLLSILALSLILCTFSRQLPGLKYARQWKFLTFNHLNVKNKTLAVFDNISFSNIIYSLNSTQYYVFHGNRALYCYKGIIGRIAPIVVHIALLIVLLGSLISSFTGFIAQEMIPEGEIFHILNITKSGLLSCLPNNLIGRIDNFYISYNFNGSVKQFYSHLFVYDLNNRYLFDKNIAVNSPLAFRGVTFYQTDWRMDALRMSLNNNQLIVQKPLNEVRINSKPFWICQWNSPAQNFLFIVTSLRDPILVYDSYGVNIGSIFLHNSIFLDNNMIAVEQIIKSSGLQIKIDKGIEIVYLGFFLLMLSTVLSYTSYSQIWIIDSDKCFTLLGSTNRAILTFEEDCMQIQDLYFRHTILNQLLE
uniref:Cytochrome c biogenesis protein Ccs1 n=1 Tax=Spyridia filamentosa TaxID=196632 RepID=A0A1Z1MJK6_SPYFI|nr:cytochrome c biogenesis protein ccs1 [Spyridia filamentosa]ARW66126.1 cytochrome c biogenesis protein ccs1 [Spyridia filamentosa]